MYKRKEKNYTEYVWKYVTYSTASHRAGCYATNLYEEDGKGTLVLSLLWFGCLYLHLPWRISEDKRYGWYLYGEEKVADEAVFAWGTHQKYIGLPWKLEFYRHTILDLGGRPWTEYGRWDWLTRNTYRELLSFYKDRNLSSFSKLCDYTNYDEEGNIKDECMVLVTIEEREWRRKWLWWTGKFGYVRKSLDVQFCSDVEGYKTDHPNIHYTDIGKKKDTWKGGVVAMGFDMKDGEDMDAALERMMREIHL